MINSFRDLRVWQLSMDLVVQIYKITQGFPNQEIYGLTSQMRRAAVSVASNIAEGHARESTKEYLRHVSVAQGSLAELDTQLEIAQRLQYAEVNVIRPLNEEMGSLSRQLYALRNALQKKMSTGPIPNS